VLATDESSPICIVLPSVERVASVIAILASLECLAFDLPESREAFLSRLQPGQRVRLYPTGEVFQVGGVTDGSGGARMLRLLLIDA
jgi:predicted aconitase with swiveling domain